MKEKEKTYTQKEVTDIVDAFGIKHKESVTLITNLETEIRCWKSVVNKFLLLIETRELVTRQSECARNLWDSLDSDDEV